RSGCTARCVAISMPKPCSKRSYSFCASMACPRCSPLTMIHTLSEALAVRDFPSALVRFLLCLGVIPNVTPPHRPDLNAYVERFHRSLGQECLQVHRPGTLQEVHEVTEAFLHHYNQERPNQARSCSNQPPRVVYSAFPTLPAVPQTVDPDGWLVHVNKLALARTIRTRGDLTINCQDY